MHVSCVFVGRSDARLGASVCHGHHCSEPPDGKPEDEDCCPGNTGRHVSRSGRSQEGSRRDGTFPAVRQREDTLPGLRSLQNQSRKKRDLESSTLKKTTTCLSIISINVNDKCKVCKRSSHMY